MARLARDFEPDDDPTRRITPLTRRDIFDYVRTEGGPWWGRLDEVDFLARVYDLEELPSYDSRFETASGDIWQHRFNNNDWDDDWVFSDGRFGLASGPDEVLLEFLSQMVHPVVQPDADRAREIVERLNELMIVGPITIRSACSHHLCPIIGKVWIGIMPNEHSNLIGLSKYVRLADWVMSRPQIQEEAVKRLADLLQERMQPDGLAMVMEADHFCMQWRGVKDTDSKMTNSVMRGVFLTDASLRREFLALLQRNTG